MFYAIFQSISTFSLENEDIIIKKNNKVLKIATGGEGVGVLGLLEILIIDCKIVTIKALQYNSEGFQSAKPYRVAAHNKNVEKGVQGTTCKFHVFGFSEIRLQLSYIEVE